MSTDHVRESQGCTLVWDGNMKNTCQVCMVKDVAQLHFPGMPEVLLLLVSKLCAWDFMTIFHNWLLRTQNGQSQLLLHS